ncbi:DUF6934 family protein [Spirosoma luteum]|uniref:DUF6934 family protein n=1 Tax=Spirosoma luteum TaxID=431553 RepID=UPI00035C5468|nr:hypothetical protein [Spirosoma luteum]
MQLEKYAVTASSLHTGYRFVSVGERGNLVKVVEYSPTDNPDEYNLAFGDYDPLTGAISDTIRSNNGDRDKVLASVGETAIDFLRYYPDATIFAKGSTESRTRTYQMGINRFYDEITQEHSVFGFRNGIWEVFEPSQSYEAFRMRRK